MQVVERSAIVAFTPAQMFALVNDVARYPEFLPWCAAARVERLSETSVNAAITVARDPLRAEFTTHNTLVPDAEIAMHLTDGPFRHMEGLWRFAAIGGSGTRVNFRVEFEFKSRLMAVALNSTFERMCSTLVDAFAQRAHAIYG